MLEGLQEFAGSFPDWLQWAAIALISAVPFIESYFGAFVGVAIGLAPVVAIAAASVGNIASMIGFVYVTGRIRDRAVGDEELTPKRARLRRMFDRWGVPGVSLLGQTVLPSQITSAAMVGFGASRRAVVVWQIVSIILWGTAFGLVAVGVLG
ncbi:hypothetical protein [Demequina sp. NBRC 110053]|uniref:hypothetical protein n=1 Tax=Demequina sp. NBRC 110053 TaxID=1570342 RepID=UPI000A05A506|nr:hypothetical protein [Demequina sp. NBRC 110053]